MASVRSTLAMTDVMVGHNMGIVKGVNLCTSFTFTSGSRREGLQKGRGWWFECAHRPRRSKHDGTKWSRDGRWCEHNREPGNVGWANHGSTFPGTRERNCGGTGGALCALAGRVAGDEYHEESAAGPRTGGSLCRSASVHRSFECAVYAGRMDA